MGMELKTASEQVETSNETGNDESGFENISPESLGMTKEDFEELGLVKKKEESKKKAKKNSEKDQAPKEKSNADSAKTESKGKKSSDLEKLLSSETEDEGDDSDVSDESESEEENEDSKDESENESDDEEESSDEKLFEIIHNDEKVELSEKEIKELAQKGFDYTKKTQAIADDRKKLSAEIDETKKEFEQAYKQLEAEFKAHDEEIQVKRQFDMAIADIASEDPSLFEQIKHYFQKAERQVSNPFFDSKVKSLQSEIEGLKSMVGQKMHETKLSEFTSEKREIERSTTGDKLAKIGLTIDWDKVQNEWAQSGKINAEQALYLVYGKDIQRLIESKSKVAKAKKSSDVLKSARTIGGIRPGKSKGISNDIAKMTTQQVKNAISTGKMSMEDYINS